MYKLYSYHMAEGLIETTSLESVSFPIGYLQEGKSGSVVQPAVINQAHTDTDQRRQHTTNQSIWPVHAGPSRNRPPGPIATKLSVSASDKSTIQ